MSKKAFTLPSSDGLHLLHGVRWTTEEDAKGVLVLVHGMVEHIERYGEFAEYLSNAGIAVIGYDQLGHGKTAVNESELGFFATEHGDRDLVQDVYRMTELAKQLYPGVPVYVLGHSMGSFVLRRFLTVYGDKIDGALICGTGNISKFLSGMALDIANVLMRIKGPFYRSPLLSFMAIGQNEKQFGNSLRPGSWLSKNEESIKAYNEDPLCGFAFTVGAYRDFFRLLKALAWERGFRNIPRDLPILLLSGMDDPLGGFQKHVLAVYNRFVEMRMEDVDVYLYPEDRHEILQELDREIVFEDVLRWLQCRIEKRAEE